MRWCWFCDLLLDVACMLVLALFDFDLFWRVVCWNRFGFLLVYLIMLAGIVDCVCLGCLVFGLVEICLFGGLYFIVGFD